MHMDELLLERFSYFLNHHPDYVTAEMLRGFMADTGYGEETSYRFLICAAMDIDPYGSETERIWFHRTIPEILHPLDTKEYAADPYLTRIAFPDKKLGRWEFRHQAYRPYEAFVRDDFRLISLGHSVPQIGYFREAFPYPAVLQDGREWMTVTPNEINTMKNPIAQSHGRVLTFGLGMGYFAFHASEKEEVDELTIVERDPDVIRLFRGVHRASAFFPGNTRQMVVPTPGSLCSSTWALWTWAPCLTMDSPRPVPPISLEWLLSTR